MLRRYRLSPLLLLALPLAWLDACGGDSTGAGAAEGPDASTSTTDASSPPEGGASDGAASQPIELKFEGRVGAEPFSCTRSYDGFGTSNATVLPGDLRFFVHDVVLLRATTHEEVPVVLATNAWQNPQVALVDLEDHRGSCTDGTDGTNDVVLGTAPPGDYDGVRFIVGVPQPLNHVNVETAEPPLPASKLQWTWANGFIHLSMEFRSTKSVADGDGGVRAVDSFYAHIGSTGCAGDPSTGGTTCARPNRPKVTLAGFTPKANKIVVDAKQLYVGSNVDENAPGSVAGCMAGVTDTDCPPMFGRLGLDFTTGAPTGESSPVFSVAPR